MDYFQMSEQELRVHEASLAEQYEAYKQQKLKLDMSRGKPCPEQLGLSKEMLDTVTSGSQLQARDGSDYLNYGGIDGIPEAKELFADILGVSPKEVIIGGNASLNMMHDTISRAMLHGLRGSKEPWAKLPKVKFICPSPGYDRHFAICELFNIEMIVVGLTPDGPDMDAVEKLVLEDESIKGIWCMPKYSNPEGITYSDATVERLARMTTKATDFRLFWDDAYNVHHLTATPDPLKKIFSLPARKQATLTVSLFSALHPRLRFPEPG